MINERENREEIYRTRRKYPWITGTLTLSNCFSLTELLPYFFKVNSSPLPLPNPCFRNISHLDPRLLGEEYFIWSDRKSPLIEISISVHLLVHTQSHEGKYFGQKLQFFPPPQTRICQFLSYFFLPTSVKIFMASFK